MPLNPKPTEFSCLPKRSNNAQPEKGIFQYNGCMGIIAGRMHFSECKSCSRRIHRNCFKKENIDKYTSISNSECKEIVLNFLCVSCISSRSCTPPTPPPPQSPTIPSDLTLPSPPNFDLDPYAIGVRQSKRARIEKKNWSPNATPQPLPSADSAAGPAASSVACPAAGPAAA